MVLTAALAGRHAAPGRAGSLPGLLEKAVYVLSQITRITHSPEETRQLAREIAPLLRPGDLLAYRGGMGAGKTTFTAGLAQGLGLGDVVSSPTFALVNECRGNGISLCHFDMFRIRGFDDLYSTGFFDYLEGDAILAVEWSENMDGALPQGATVITFDPAGEDARRITIEGDERFDHLGC